MQLSIGILAYNESSSIGTTIKSIFAQSLFVTPPAGLDRVEIVVVPNGCTDDTANVARRALEEATRGLPAFIETRVCELAKGSKVHAWNEFVHRLSNQGADRVLVMDGDIRIEHPETFKNVLAAFDAHPEASLSSPRAVKHIELRPRRGPFEWLSVKLGSLNRARPWGFAGCCYCLRGEVARQIYLPEGMVGEDAFLNGMVVTDRCRNKERYERVVRPADATVVFEAYTRAGKMYRVLRRQAVTRGTNAMLWSYLWANTTPERDAGAIIRDLNAGNPDWFAQLIRRHVERSGWWVMPKGATTRRLRYLRFLSWPKAILMAPVAVAGCIVDVAVHVAANRMIRRGQVTGLWEATRTTHI